MSVFRAMRALILFFIISWGGRNFQVVCKGVKKMPEKSLQNFTLPWIQRNAHRPTLQIISSFYSSVIHATILKDTEMARSGLIPTEGQVWSQMCLKASLNLWFKLHSSEWVKYNETQGVYFGLLQNFFVFLGLIHKIIKKSNMVPLEALKLLCSGQ